MGRRLAPLTLDTLPDLPDPCRRCVLWELEPVAADRAAEAGDTAFEKEAWVSATLLEWGSCGRVAYVDGDPAGYVIYAPPSFVPGADMFPTAPVGEDAVLLVTAMVHPAYAGSGLGRVLMQTAVKDVLQRRGVRALEAFGDTRAPDAQTWARTSVYGDCVLPADYLLAVGFKTQRSHPRHPRMRLELRSVLSWRDEVESAIERLLGAVRPARRPAADPSHRVIRGSGPPPR